MIVTNDSCFLHVQYTSVCLQFLQLLGEGWAVCLHVLDLVYYIQDLVHYTRDPVQLRDLVVLDYSYYAHSIL